LQGRKFKEKKKQIDGEGRWFVVENMRRGALVRGRKTAAGRNQQ
jgi:hypothetical protein